MSKYQSGVSGNPQGRPKGIEDKRSSCRRLLKEHSESLVNKLVEMALNGDIQALRLCIERLIPRVRDEEINLPTEEHDLEKIGDIISLGGQIIQKVGNGDLSPEQGRTLTHMLDVQSKLIEISQLANRIDALEQVLKSRKRP